MLTDIKKRYQFLVPVKLSSLHTVPSILRLCIALFTFAVHFHTSSSNSIPFAISYNTQDLLLTNSVVIYHSEA